MYDVSLAYSKAPGVWFVLVFNLQPMLALKRPVYLILATTFFSSVCHTPCGGIRVFFRYFLSSSFFPVCVFFLCRLFHR